MSQQITLNYNLNLFVTYLYSMAQKLILKIISALFFF